ncbi:PIN domain-containing protein [Arenibacter sp. S6351L]|uniref:PIN domain-containing protein n=1 Tax=Arenibacter sp. S6351L TaxID=2926407 RepID=UPI001FF6E4FF|nr:PIN domain-containing protein [Arenibacter sp. S6351L]MCK0134916.1 PIN domain-containing protein [Arenibacter sp. S6351L]
MLIFIDSNIFYNNWYLESANFKSFLNYVERTNTKILISEIVCREVDNSFLTEMASLQQTFKIALNRSKSLMNKSLNLDLKELDTSYSLRQIILKNTKKVVYLPFDNIENSILVDRAIKRIKPFQDKDKGFRDSLIWLSLLEYLQKQKGSEKVIFINNNASDFFNNDKTDLHSDLKNDIEEAQLKNDFKVFKSINDFIGGRAEEIHQNLTDEDILEKYIYPFEDEIQFQLDLYINEQTIQWFNQLLRDSSTSFSTINYVTDFSLEIFEGIEDPELLNWSFLAKDLIFIELSFILRIVNIEFTIPRIVYDDDKFLLKKELLDIKRSKDYVTINTIRRVFVNTSFNINIEDEEDVQFVDLSINEFTI